MSENTTSRRRLLTAATAGAAAVAAAQLARPLSVAADTGGTLTLGQSNSADATTSLAASADVVTFMVGGSTTQANLVEMSNGGTGLGLMAQCVAGSGIQGLGGAARGSGVQGVATAPTGAGVVGSAGSTADSALDDPNTSLEAGVYGYAYESQYASGIWGEGLTGVVGTGALGGWFFGTKALTAQPLNRSTGIGLQAYGRIVLPDRAKKLKISARKKAVTATWTGVTSANLAIATLNTNRTGRYVQSVVCSSGKVTVTLNGSVSGTTYVTVLILG